LIEEYRVPYNEGVFMKHMLLLTVVALIWTTSLSGQDKSATPPSSLQPTMTTNNNVATFTTRYPRYKLRPGDTADISFELTPEFNQSVTVQPDGFIALRDAGDVNANGLTLPELTEKIRAAYSHVLSNPRISVLLKDFEKPYFIADGQVVHPGKYDLRGDTTLVQAVALAGGFTNAAKHSQVVLFRRVNDDWVEGRLLNVKEMLNNRNLSEDLHMKPGDYIYVPKNKISKIQQFLPNYGISMTPAMP
jgi:polysaccharide export outer membrane protein